MAALAVLVVEGHVVVLVLCDASVVFVVPLRVAGEIRRLERVVGG
jgi:hypothetical protein